MKTKIEISAKELPLISGGCIHEVTLSNGRLTIVVHDFGARLHKIFAPDKHGAFENILLSRDDSNSYFKDGGYYGVTCGPVAGRIAGAQYDAVKFDPNENGNLLHSGDRGWERQFWNYETFENKDSLGIELALTDRSSGFPGSIQTKVVYELVGNQLKVTHSAISEKETLFNPAWHPYFNLSADRESTLKQVLTVSADQLVEVDAENIPTGRLLPVDGTIYDLRGGRSIQEIQEKLPTGFDNCFVYPATSAEKTLTLFAAKSGRKLICKTDRQSVVIYTATNPEQNSTISGRKMTPNRGIAVEFQEIPDSVHHPDWGSVRLQAGEEKVFTTSYVFTVN